MNRRDFITGASLLSLLIGLLVAMGGCRPESEQMAALKAENEALRLENQQLRRELVAKRAGTPGAALPVRATDVAAEAPPEATGPETGYWMSAKSHIRHNAKCRNYRKVKGHPCGPTDGKPCKACGG